VKPDTDFVLRMIATKLVSEVAPTIGDRYVRSNLEVAAALLLVAAEDYDRAAHVRAEENRAIRELLRGRGPGVDEPALRARLLAGAETSDESLRVRDLDRMNAALRTLLVELHAHADRRTDAWAAETRAAVWRELAAGVERRAIGFYPL
jgi:hypothetical protein